MQQVIDRYIDLDVKRQALAILIFSPVPAALVSVQAEYMPMWGITVLLMVRLGYGLGATYCNSILSAELALRLTVICNVSSVFVFATLAFIVGNPTISLVVLAFSGGFIDLLESTADSKIIQQCKNYIAIDDYRATRTLWISTASLIGMGLATLYYLMNPEADMVSVWVGCWLIANIIWAALDIYKYNLLVAILEKQPE